MTTDYDPTTDAAKQVRRFVRRVRKNHALAQQIAPHNVAYAEARDRGDQAGMAAARRAVDALPRVRPISKKSKHQAYAAAARIERRFGLDRCMTVDDLAAACAAAGFPA